MTLKQVVLLKGISASGGKVKGKVSVVKNPAKMGDIKENSILVTPFTTPLMVVAIFKASGIITDIGGITSHAATISRELGIPCIVGTKNATELLKDGMEVLVDGDEGFVYGNSVE